MFFWIICACIMASSGETENDVNLQQQDNNAINPPVPIDTIGMFSSLLNNIITQLTRNLSTPLSYECSVQSIFVGVLEFKFVQHPLGYCSFCCPYKKLKDHINLYFTNKSKLGNLVQLKMTKQAGNLRAAGVNSELPTVVYIHGFTEHGRGANSMVIRDAYLKRKEDYNIILVDWCELGAGPWYNQAVENVQLVGKFLGEFFKFYNRTGELPISKLHIIGFSLGSHVAGFIGRALNDGYQKIPRITALDPAGPLYMVEGISRRIKRIDAEFVDVIHTNGNFFGYPRALGHADFFPNGENFFQPGCELSKLVERQNIENLFTCGHFRACYLYAESVVNPTAFPATKCGVEHNRSFKRCSFITHGYMGFPAAKNATSGNFYLTTNDHAPFSKSAKEQKNDMKKIHILV